MPGAGKVYGYPGKPTTEDPLTLSLILNVIFAAFVLTVIPGMLVWAIRTSRNDSPPQRRAVRRPMPHPSYAGSRISSGQRRRATARGPVQDAG